jgi:lysophospholipase L1-like esterase
MLKRLGAVLIVGGLALAIPTAPAAAAVPAGLNYVALGDSYSAGFGPFPVVPGSPDGCYRTQDNYPHQVAAALGLVLTDVTCSGAVTANIDTTGQVTMNGVGPLPLQGASLDATTDVVTLTIGGNDLGFATVASQCIKLDNVTEDPIGTPGFANCKDFFNPFPGTDTLIDKLDDTVTPALDRVFDAIRAAAPNAKVFVLGYPSIAPDFAHAPTGCYTSPVGATWPNPPFPQDTVPYGAIDIHYLHHIENEMDLAIQAQAGSHGFTYIPTWAATLDHTVCSTDSYIFGVGFTNIAADGTSTGLPGLYASLGALHPKANGIAFLAAQAIAAIQGHPDFADAEPAATLPPTGPQPAMLLGFAVTLVGLGLVAIRRRGSRPAARR